MVGGVAKLLYFYLIFIGRGIMQTWVYAGGAVAAAE